MLWIHSCSSGFIQDFLDHVVLMSGERRRQWYNISSTERQVNVFTGPSECVSISQRNTSICLCKSTKAVGTSNWWNLSFPNINPTFALNAQCFCAAEDTATAKHFILVDIRCDTMMGRVCTGVTAPLQAMGQHWDSIGSMYGVYDYTAHCTEVCPASKMPCPISNRCWPAPAMLAQHLAVIGSVSACTLWAHWHQHEALLGVAWVMAGAGDDGPALNLRWVSVMLTCSGHRHQLEIVMDIELKPN